MMPDVYSEIYVNEPRKRLTAYAGSFVDDDYEIVGPGRHVDLVGSTTGLPPSAPATGFMFVLCDASTPSLGLITGIGANYAPKHEFYPDVQSPSSNTWHITAEQIISESIINNICLTPFEACEEHPLENVIINFLNREKVSNPALIFGKLYDQLATQPSHAYTLIRVLGRIDESLTLPWIHDILKSGLGHSDIEVRSAAAYAIDSLGDRDSIAILREHNEVVPWLQDYIEEVIADHS